LRRGLAVGGVLAALLAVPASAAAGQMKAGVGKVDGSWHVGASAGQYASDGTSVSPDDGTYDPTVDSYRRRSSYGIQSRLDVRAIVVEGPDGKRFALVKNDFYIPQDLIWRRTAQILEQDHPGTGIGKTNLTMAITHDHSSPFYASSSWGVWTFQDVFDIRFYNYYAHRMADAVVQAASHLVPVRVGASVRQFDKTHRHSFGTARADDGTPAGYPTDNTDHDMTVVRFDDITDPGNPKPLANIVNFGLHGEFLDGNDLISADFVAPLEKFTDDATGAMTIWTQNAVGTSEPERSTYHSIHERDEFTHHEYRQAEYGASLMSTAIKGTFDDIANGTPQDPTKYAPFKSDFDNNQVAVKDQWFPGPVSHPYPGVSSCRTDPALSGDPRLPIVGLPDCEGVENGLNDLAGLIGLPGPGDVPLYPIDPGLNTDDFERLGIPVPENYSAPAYTGLEEDIDVHLQAMRIGDILFTVCSCEQWFDQSKNIKTRTDQVAGNEYLGWDWKNGTGARVDGGTLQTSNIAPGPCTKNNDGTYGGASPGYGTGTWSCPAPADPSADLPDKLVEKMHRQVVNPANGWNNFENGASAESEPADLTQIKGNYTHDDDCVQNPLPVGGTDEPKYDFWNKPCVGNETSPSADLGYRLTVPISMANDYNGYIATYREYQRGDHYRKALTGWGAHSSDYFASRLVNMGRVLHGGDPTNLLPSEAADDKITADLANNDARAQALGTTGENATTAYEAQLPDDGGAAHAVDQPPDVERFDGTFFTWNGGSNYTDNPDVHVQRKLAGVWHDYAGQAGEIPVTIQYPQGTSHPSYETGSFEWHWTAHFEAFASPFKKLEGDSSTPTGVYRFVVDGQQRKNHQVVPYHVESGEFEVRPWSGVTVDDLKLEADRTVSFKVGPRTTRTLAGGAPTLNSEIGPIDYPDTYDYPSPGKLPNFIEENWRGLRDPAAPTDPTKVEWFCDECAFRPWLDAGDADTAKVAFVASDGSVHQVDATKSGDRWQTSDALPTGATARVGKGCVQDQFGDFNGADSAAVGGAAAAPPGCATEDPQTSAGGAGSTPGGGNAGAGGGGGLSPGVENLLGQLGAGRCSEPIGRIHGRILGPTALGRTRGGERRAFPAFDRRRAGVDRFCLRGGGHIRIGYMSPAALSRLAARRRGAARAVLILTTSPHYAIKGIRHGSTRRALRRRLGRARSVKVGRNRWYLVRGRRARLVFKTRGGRVEEVGIAALRPTRRARQARRFLRSFPG
jgi:hypothetical protein